MTPREERLASLDMSPPELVIWHGMGAEVHPSRLADLNAQLHARRQNVRDRHGYHPTSDVLMAAGMMWDARPDAYTPSIAQAAQNERMRGKVNLNRQCKAVVLLGVPYPSIGEAARRLGMHRTRLQRWVKEGTADEQLSQGVENGATNGCDARRRVPAVGSAA